MGGNSAWHAAFMSHRAAAATFAQGGGGAVFARLFSDSYGDAFVNADLRFNVLSGVTLDAMWLDVDGDGDNLTSFGEPNAYAVESNNLVILQPPQYLDVNWEILTEGRWQFDLSLNLYGYGGGGGPPPPPVRTPPLGGGAAGALPRGPDGA